MLRIYLPFAVGDAECMVVADLKLSDPVRNLILVVVLDIAPKFRTGRIHLRTTTLLAAPGQVKLPRVAIWQSFEDKEPRQAQSALKAPLKDGWVDPRSHKSRPVDFEVAVRILGEAVLVRGTSSGEIDRVDLGDIASQSSRRDIDLAAIVASTTGVDVEAG